MFLCSGQQPAIHHLAQCWSGSLRQHRRSLNHSISTKDRYICRARGMVRIATGLPIMGNHMSGAIHRMVATEGFQATLPGNHIGARAQEALLSRACVEDARVALLESVFVAMVLHVGRQSRVPFGGSPTAVAAPPNPIPVSEGWAQLDTVDLQEELLTCVPMLKSCSHWLRGRFREGLTVALRERHRAKLANDELGQIRAWKLFCLVPEMLLHRPRNTGSVGRDELARRGASRNSNRDIGCS